MPVASGHAHAPAQTSREEHDDRRSLAASGHSRFRRDAPYLATITLAVLLLSIAYVFPAIWAIYASLTDRALLGFGAQETEFIGLDNYRRLWDTPDFPKFVRNSVAFVIGSAVIGQTGLGFVLALLIDHAHRCRARLGSLAYAAVLVAWVSPPAFAAAVWGNVFDYRHGVLNSALGSMGIGPVDMLGEYPMLSVILADVWRGTAFAMVIFLGALQTIPPQVHEAARLDGAGAVRRLRDLTVPLLAHIGAIVTATREQSTGLQEINTAVNTMDQGTQQNAAMVEEQTAASHGLASEAAALNELLSQFNLSSQVSPVARQPAYGRRAA